MTKGRSSDDWSRMSCVLVGTLVTACTVAPPDPSSQPKATPLPAVASAKVARFREGCPLQRWDSVDTVKAFYGIDYDPIEEPHSLAGSSPQSRAFWRSGYYY
jgi:hypothetical protein